jgi:4-hydroxybenzoate polyprenyltransferase
MTMNRIADVEFDRRNPRTANRALPAGQLSMSFAVGFTALASALLVIAAWQLNRLALELSPLALALLFLYSYTKRFTSFSHIVLGLCLGISPGAAWVAIRGSVDWRILILCAAVTLWVAGFDVLYACQDVDFDRQAGLFSIPKRVGVARALLIARFMHAAMIGLLVWLTLAFQLAWPAWIGLGVVASLIAYEHSLVRPDDLSKMNAAFFTVNGYISVLFLIFWGAASLVSHP